MKSPTGDFHTEFQETTPPPYVAIGIWVQPALPPCHVGASAYPHMPYPTYCPTPLFPRCLCIGVSAHKDIPCAIHCPGLRFLHCQHVSALPHNFMSVRTMDTTSNECSSLHRRIGTYIILTLGLQREIESRPAWADVLTCWHTNISWLYIYRKRFLHCRRVSALPHNFISLRTMDTTLN